MFERVCKRCGSTFTTKWKRQSYCHQAIEVPCAVCGNLIETRCDDTTPITCSRKCATKNFSTRICSRCGVTFKPKSANQHFCNRKIDVECKGCKKTFKSICNYDTPRYCSISCGTKNSHHEVRTCVRCGKQFIAKNSRQQYCGDDIEISCAVCKTLVKTKCIAEIPLTCGSSCANRYMYVSNTIIRKCKRCGEEFRVNSSYHNYCNQMKKGICKVCGREFEYKCCHDAEYYPDNCRSSECSNYLRVEGMKKFYANYPKKCILCGEEFQPRTITHQICDKAYHEFKCEFCGKSFFLDREYIRKSWPQDIRKTCSEECKRNLQSVNNGMHEVENQLKVQETCLKKYGKRFAVQSVLVQKKMWDSYYEKTNYSHPSHNPEVRKRAAKNRKHSKLEDKIAKLFDIHEIKYIRHHMITNESTSLAHEFDFYLYEKSILVDADGVYFHSYLSDPDGDKCGDYYDDIRISLVPEDHAFFLFVEDQGDWQMSMLKAMIAEIGRGNKYYESFIHDWCRQIQFPYPNYNESRLKNDFQSLSNYASDEYNPRCKLGESLIKQFHKSLYFVQHENLGSLYDFWNNDAMLLEAIQDRIIYMNDVDPSKLLRGLNVSNKYPHLSYFNPILAKYLISKYLNEFDTIFDPFSGFSGRMLGAASLSKRYIGRDLNSTSVGESNQIISYLNLAELCDVKQADILQSQGEYQCLLTCPPYGKKEIYREETVFHSCDEWIEECLSRFKCKRYVFVVDETQKYSQFIREEIASTSHFSNVREKVIVVEA